MYVGLFYLPYIFRLQTVALGFAWGNILYRLVKAMSSSNHPPSAYNAASALEIVVGGSSQTNCPWKKTNVSLVSHMNPSSGLCDATLLITSVHVTKVVD